MILFCHLRLTQINIRTLLITVLFSSLLISGCANYGGIPTPHQTEVATPTINQSTVTPAKIEASPTVIQSYSATEEATPRMNKADADVKYVKAIQASNGTWTFHVTVFHPDKGWEDYTNGWDVLTPDGVVIKPDQSSQFTRLLLHPHVGEQPFTRSQAGIVIPDGVTVVTVRANDMIDGFGGEEVTVDLTKSYGDNYEVQTAN